MLLRPNVLSAGWSPAWLVLGEHLLLSLLFLPILWRERLNLAALTVILLQKTQPIVAILLAGLALKERRQPLFWVWCRWERLPPRRIRSILPPGMVL